MVALVLMLLIFLVRLAFALVIAVVQVGLERMLIDAYRLAFVADSDLNGPCPSLRRSCSPQRRLAQQPSSTP